MKNLIKLTLSDVEFSILNENYKNVLEAKRKFKEEKLKDIFYKIKTKKTLFGILKDREVKYFDFDHPELLKLPLGIKVFDYFGDVFIDTNYECDQYLKVMEGLSLRFNSGDTEFELFLEPALHNFICKVLYNE